MKTITGIGLSGVLIFGGIDASTLNEQPLTRDEVVAGNSVSVRQRENTVETSMSWKDQPGLKVVVDLGEPTTEEKIKDKRKKEVITEVVDFGEGGFKIDILLDEKPDTNRFCYQIQGAENYDFFYQPPLTAEEIAEGASRPPEIEGSYAVYHKTLKNHEIGKENYATGKVMHIPRPQVWEVNDQANTTEWADLSYDNGQLCVTASQDFLNSAKYPVRIDPAFGYTTKGASSFGSGGSKYKGTKGTVTDNNQRLVSVSVWGYGFSATANLKGGVYDTSGNLVSGNETAVTMPNTSTSSLYTFSVSGNLTGGQNYVAMSMMEGTGSMAYDAGGTDGYRAATAYGAWANPVTWGSTDSAEKFSVYATYEPLPHGVYINNGTIKINNGTLDL
jgi:hypothetical protein